jgi:hypothetical protein|tara:strand:- start:613 stop:1344 length:732 start_codon:yes stop_codon:yes gene_type:complete
MKYCILNNGCSHSAKTTFTRTSYCDFLPGDVYNIATPNSAVECNTLKEFLYENSDIVFTHYIYQIPSPTKQLQYLGRQWCGDMAASNRSLVKRWGLNDNEFSRTPMHMIAAVQKHISLICNHYRTQAKSRGTWDSRITNPITKIILLRYEETKYPLVYELGKKDDPLEYWLYICVRFFVSTFYKDLLDLRRGFHGTNFHNVRYIYENDFNTERFKANGWANDEYGHPNEIGAKVIADKIKEYL